MTDEERIESLGFVKEPTCPLEIVRPAESREWLEKKSPRRNRYRSRDKLGYIDWVARQWDEFDRRKPDLDLLNQSLEKVIREEFRAKFSRDPTCNLEQFLYVPRGVRGAHLEWSRRWNRPFVASWGEFEALREMEL